MDVTQEIKSRLPIEDLVGRYCQLHKKGRTFTALCPFHNDSHPSLLISPDKGIAYCFACQSGGDIFSFYQKIEGVEFRQALRDLGDMAGVKVEDAPVQTVKKDEKERLRDCLEAALLFYRDQLASSEVAMKYLTDRDVPAEQMQTFELGYAPESFSATYEHLLKKGFSRREILDSGLGVQKDLREERIYDRFRHRLIFPIHDHQGKLVGFGGRTLGEDDAKYINSAEGVLYHKSAVLYGFHHAKEAMRKEKRAIVVEGYFDLLACHRVGIEHVVATSGTALTEQHVKLLQRHAENVSLCLDADRAGREASERAFLLLSEKGVSVRSIELPRKDASELLLEDRDLLKATLAEGGIPYIDRALSEIAATDLHDTFVRREGLRRLLTLLAALPFAVERKDYVAKAAGVFATTEAALDEDLRQTPRASIPTIEVPKLEREKGKDFTKEEIALGLFFLYPRLRNPLLTEFIEPEDTFAKALFQALKSLPDGASIDALSLGDEFRERVGILVLFCEEHGFAEWSENMAIREIRKNVIAANRVALHHRQEELGRRLIAARAARNATEEALLQNQYQQVLKLRNMAG